MAEHRSQQAPRGGLLSSVSWGAAAHGLSHDELKCPICVETIQDAFVTTCGHTFCYSCISTHLKNKNSCPSCSNHLTQEHIHPNFLLNKVLSAAAASPVPQRPGLLDTILAVLHREGRNRPSVADIQAAVQLLQDKKQELESHEEWHSLQLLLLFLQRLRAQKQEAVTELQQQLAFLARDLDAVSRQRVSLAVAGGNDHLQQLQLAAAKAPAGGNGVHTGSPASAAMAAAAAATLAMQQRHQQQPQHPMHAPWPAMPRAVSAPDLAAAGQRSPAAGHAWDSPLQQRQQQQQQQQVLPPSRQPATPQRRRSAAAPATLQLPQQQQQGWPSGLATFSQGPTLGEGLGIGNGFKPYLAPSATPRLAVPSPAVTALPAEDASPRLSSNGSGSGGANRSGPGPSSRRPGDDDADDEGLGFDERAAKKRRILSQFDELQEAYLAMSAQQQHRQQQQQGQQEQGQRAPRRRANGDAKCSDEAAVGDDDGSRSDTNSSGTPPPPPIAPRSSPVKAAQQTAAAAPAPNAQGAAPAAGASNAQPPPTAAAAAAAAKEAEPRAGLDAFNEVLTAATVDNRLQLVAELPPAELEPLAGSGSDSSSSSNGSGDGGAACNILSSIEFDMEGRVVAVAGAQQRILVYDYEAIASSQPSSAPKPLLQLPSRSRVSCLSFSRASQQELLSSDYDGTVVLWDAECGKAVMDWDAHSRRIWSVDFATQEADMFATGSDDGKVRIWTTAERDALMSLDVQANVCSVHFNPEAGHMIAVGSAGHAVLLYDMRAAREPYSVLLGHGKAVSYVKWAGETELLSASTDGTLRLWDTEEGSCVRTYTGHTNARNFVGLSVGGSCGSYIACGSETNEVYLYRKELARPAASYRLGSAGRRLSESADSTGGCSGGSSGADFVSAICWRPGADALLAANSQGNICALALRS